MVCVKLVEDNCNYVKCNFGNRNETLKNIKTKTNIEKCSGRGRPVCSFPF